MGDFYKDKKVLVAGGTGLIGRPLVEMLINRGAEVRVSSLDDVSRVPIGTRQFIRKDLTNFENCMEVCKDMDYIFNLLGVKGGPKMVKEKPTTFFDFAILFNTNLLRAAKKSQATHYLYTSSIGVYGPAEVFQEDDVWKTFPSEKDWFGGWAKRMGELQVDAYQKEYGWDEISIVRPANVYGPYDNFDPANAMVIPSLIRRAMDGENPLSVWGDGKSTRDFVYASDVARGMMLVVERGFNKPVNLAGGKAYTIKEAVEIITNNLENKPEIIWDTSKPRGDKNRLMDISRAQSIGWNPDVSLEEGIKKTMEWYSQNKGIISKRYNVFREK